MRIARLIIGFGLTLVSAAGASDVDASSKVFAAWSQVYGETDVKKAPNVVAPTGFFRFVTDAPDCTGFSVRYDTPAQSGQTLAGPLEKRDGQFTSVTVCSATMGSDWTAAHLYDASGAQATLTSLKNAGTYYSNGKFYYDSRHTSEAPWIPNAGANGKPVTVAGPGAIGQNGDLTLVTLGDTGCRGWPPGESGRSVQNCDGGWPLDWLSDQAAGYTPDLVVHVGDYRYFYEGDKDKRWLFWAKDFFPMAQQLLSAAPWVFLRGNHEGCQNSHIPFGAGYFQLFGDPAGNSCAGVQQDMYGKPWFFDVQPGGIVGETAFGPGAHRFVSIDVNNYETTQSPNVAVATANFTTARTMATGGPASSWWLAHTPPISVLYYGGKDHFGEKHVLKALNDSGTDFCGTGTGEGRCKPSQFVLGHEHLYQDMIFPTPEVVPDPDHPGQTKKIYPTDGLWLFPRQVIVGHGGVKLDNGNPAPRHHHHCNFEFSDFMVNGENLTAVVYTKSEFGLVVWTRSAKGGGDQSGWSPKYLWSGNPTLQDPPAPTDGKHRHDCR